MELMKVIALINSLCALGISISVLIYSILVRKKYELIIAQYSGKLKHTQIDKIKIYNFIRQKRNNAIIKKTAFEEGAYTTDGKIRRAFKSCTFAASKEEKVLKEIEDYIQKENLIEV